LPWPRFIIADVNFRKAKVSKAAWLAALMPGLLVVAPSPPPPQRPALMEPAALAYAEPPPLAAGLIAGLHAEHARAMGTCANAPRELRFEMITAASDPYPPAWRNPAVCLAVYIPRR
jgi:hypothetical protein